MKSGNPIPRVSLLLMSIFLVALGLAQSHAAHVASEQHLENDGKIGIQQTTQSATRQVPISFDKKRDLKGSHNLRKENESRHKKKDYKDTPLPTDLQGKSKGRGRVKRRGRGMDTPSVPITPYMAPAKDGQTGIHLTSRAATGQLFLDEKRDGNIEGTLISRRESERKLRGRGKNKDSTGWRGKAPVSTPAPVAPAPDHITPTDASPPGKKRGKNKGKGKAPALTPAPVAPTPVHITPTDVSSPLIYPRCEICGAGFQVGSHDAIVTFSKQAAPVTCGILEARGHLGQIKPKKCNKLPGLVFQTCGCANATPPTL